MAEPSEPFEVVDLTTPETYPIRLAVLRHDTPTKEVGFPGDDEPGARHLGVVDHGLAEGDRLIATSTWLVRSLATEAGTPAVQLRGMATLGSHQGRGIGALLVEAGCAHARAVGAELVWANARDTALAFYGANGFEVVGDGFVDAATQLPHHVVVRRL